MQRIRNLNFISRSKRRKQIIDSGAFSEYTAPVTFGTVEQAWLGCPINFLSTGSSYSYATSRIQLAGPYEITETSAVSKISVKMTITTAAPVRPVIYNESTAYVDSGALTSTTSTNPVLSTSATVGTAGHPGKPGTLALVGSEVTLNTGTDVVYELPISGTLAPGWYWIGFLSGASGAGTFYKTSSSTKSLWRTNSGQYTYNSTATPPNIVSQGNTYTIGQEPRMWADITPTVTAPTTVTVIANSDRTATITISGGDSRTQLYQIERSKNGGGFTAYALSHTATFNDAYLEAGATYQYRVASKYKTGVSSYTTSNTITASGNSYAYSSINLSANLLSDTATSNRYGGGAIKFASTAFISGIDGGIEYRRTGGNFDWVNIEPTEGNYDFSGIETFIQSAIANGRLAAFRVRCVVSTGNTQRLVPAYITGGSGTNQTYTPDWDSAQMLARVPALYAALGAQFNGDPRIAFIDVGMYADYGEWRDSPAGTPASQSTLQTYLSACMQAFPDTLCILSSPNNDEIIRYGYQNYSNFGIRQDALGERTGFMNLSLFCGRSEYARRNIMSYTRARHCEHSNPSGYVDPDTWTDALRDTIAHRLTAVMNTNVVPASYAGYSSTAQNAILEAWARAGARIAIPYAFVPNAILNDESFTITSTWQNRGLDALHEPWIIKWQLRNTATGAIVTEFDSTLDLRNVYPTVGYAEGVTHTDRFTATNIPPGTYDLCVQIPGFNAYAPALKLAQSGEQTGTYYIIKEDVTVE